MGVVEYWDKEWTRRTAQPGMIRGNNTKAERLINALWKRPFFIPMRKLEVGCGPCLHIQALRQWNPLWGENYIGLDLSEVAIRRAQEAGVRAFKKSILDFQLKEAGFGFDGRFELFLFLDVLEHIEDHEGTAAKLRELGNPDGFMIFGNVPLYRSKHEQQGGFEREMNVDVLKAFLNAAGAGRFHHSIYGINGWPYMQFEAFAEPKKEPL
jgi:SAM-dependent methyltransferase